MIIHASHDDMVANARRSLDPILRGDWPIGLGEHSKGIVTLMFGSFGPSPKFSSKDLLEGERYQIFSDFDCATRKLTRVWAYFPTPFGNGGSTELTKYVMEE